MNGSTLTFEWTAATLAMSVLIVLITAGFSFVSWRRSGYRRAIGLLESLRMAVVIFAAILFNQPEIIEEFHVEEKPSIAVLWDNSPSMETRDVVDAAQPKTEPMTRREALAPLLDSSTWKELQERFEIVIQPFSTTEAASLSNLHKPLASAPQKVKNLPLLKVSSLPQAGY